MAKPFSSSCEKNKDPILSVLKELFCDAGSVLELGSGTGQHAIYFAQNLPHLLWIPTEIEDKIKGIKMWLDEAALSNVESPRVLDLLSEKWPTETIKYIFTANTTHYVSWECVQGMFKGVGRALNEGGIFVQYGPFNYANQFTSESNAKFDSWLKSQDPTREIKNFEDLQGLAQLNGMKLLKDYEMPSNNRILSWIKVDL